MISTSRFTLLMASLLILVTVACSGVPEAEIPTLQATLSVETVTSAATPQVVATEMREVVRNAPPTTIRFIHTAPDLPAVNIYLGRSAIATNLTYTQFTEPTQIPSGEIQLRVLPSGAGSDAEPFLEESVTLAEDTPVLILLTGANETNNFHVLTEIIDPLNSGETAIRFINAAADSGSVTIEQNGNTITTPAGYREAVSSTILSSEATVFNFEANGARLLEWPIELEERLNYTIILAGSAGAYSAFSFSNRAPGRAGVRVINASSAFNEVDLYLDERLIAGKVGYGRVSERTDIAAVEYEVLVYAAEADRGTIQPIIRQPILIEEDIFMTLLVTGSENEMVVLPYVENSDPTPPETARVTFVNTLDNIPTVAIESSTGADIPNVTYGREPITITLPSLSFSFFISEARPDGMNPMIEFADHVLLEAGRSYIYLITGRQDNNPIILSDRVGVNESLAAQVGDEPQLESAAQIRFINAVAGSAPLDLWLNGSSTYSGVEYAASSELIAVEEINLDIGISVNNNVDLLTETFAVLEDKSYYTIVAYGVSGGDIQIMVMPDSDLIFTEQSPRLRLINVSSDPDALLGLGSSPLDTQENESLTGDSDLRRSIPLGVTRLANDISGGSYSNIILVSAGNQDIEILDSTTSQLARTLPNVALEGGAHYDIFAYVEPESLRVSAFIIPYPPR